MRTILVVLVLALGVLQDPERYPGQHNHDAPPAGWMCEPQNIELSVPPDHACNCERMYDEGTKRVIEDSRCAVYCHMDHCSCRISNSQAMPK